MDFRTAQPRGVYGEIIEYSCLSGPSKTGSRTRGKKGELIVEKQYLEEAFADFSGYIAADELYDGPFCVLSIVDNRQFRRLIYEVLDHDPTQDDIRKFFARFKKELDSRGLTLQGVTTDGSSLYPTPIHEIFGEEVRHQVCEFHVLKELNRSILHAVAKVRKQLKSKMPKLPRGRPGKTARRQARKKKKLEKKATELFENRYLFVRRCLTPGEKKTFLRITRGLKALRTLRDIVEEVYRLFDRRCCTDTALKKLAKLRRRVRRFKSVGKTLRKIDSPNLEKALTFLDDKLLPATSNAVERGYRRHRKMQKTVYRVRSCQRLKERIALDMLREAQTDGRFQALQILHGARARAA